MGANGTELSPAILKSGYIEPSARKTVICSSSLHEKESGVVPPQSKAANAAVDDNWPWIDISHTIDKYM
ncbi:MAG: hypothetical protein AB1611_21070 [bacterium]